MVSRSLWAGVEEVLDLVKEHSEKYQAPKQVTTTLGRLSGWLTSAGGILFVAGVMLQQVGDEGTPPFVYLTLVILGFILFLVGGVMGVVEFLRTMRHPLVELIERTREALHREYPLILALDRFEPLILELASKRLQLESKKVASRLGVIGGGDGLRASIVGVAMLGTGLISEYEPVVHGWSAKSLALFGGALLLGLSIGGLLVRHGASQAEYFSEIIELVLLRKSRMAKLSRRPFSDRFALKRRNPPN